MAKVTKAESARLSKAKSRDLKTPQGHGETLILKNERQVEFLEIPNACFDLLQPAHTTARACSLTLTYRKAQDKIRRLRGGNILNKIPVLQNEPTDLSLSRMDSTSDVHEISTEPNEPTAPSDSLPAILGILRIRACNYIYYGLTVKYSREIPVGLAELHRLPQLIVKLQDEPTEPAKQALNGRDQPLNGAPNPNKAEKTALMIYSGSSIGFQPQRGAIES